MAGELQVEGVTVSAAGDPRHIRVGLQIVIVTPEKAVLDQKADFIVLPMIDGELGVLPQHAPLIGRLGKGELRITKGGVVSKWQVAGGFAQVRSNVITVLTGSAASSV